MANLTLQDFFKITTQRPIPEALKALPICPLSPARSWRFCHADFGFLDHPRSYVERAQTGDEESQLLVERALELYLKLMEADEVTEPKLNDIDGSPVLDDNGNKVLGLRSAHMEVRGSQNKLLPGNPRLPLDFWFQYVRQNWHKILPELRWFDPVPSTDPEDPHTAALIARQLHPQNPKRRWALEFLKKNGIEAEALPASTDADTEPAVAGGKKGGR